MQVGTIRGQKHQKVKFLGHKPTQNKDYISQLPATLAWPRDHVWPMESWLRHCVWVLSSKWWVLPFSSLSCLPDVGNVNTMAAAGVASGTVKWQLYIKNVERTNKRARLMMVMELQRMLPNCLDFPRKWASFAVKWPLLEFCITKQASLSWASTGTLLTVLNFQFPSLWNGDSPIEMLQVVSNVLYVKYMAQNWTHRKYFPGLLFSPCYR